ncbi:hypothetical protein ACH50O_03835 [Methylomonas sp. 2BW1-5-20]|uniref:hypothetical protein n=1 Tax=Methylomonas sp. 2BW1-5-20 TaxID=3376686 RepID=UPI00405137EB
MSDRSGQDQKDSSKKDDEYREVVKVLSNNNVNLYVWYEDKWSDPEPTTLLRIFEAIAPSLQVENSLENIGTDIALALAKPGYRSKWPVPTNHIKHWLSDFLSLGLMEPSSKKHSVTDKYEYWSLSKFGRDVFSSLRKLELWAGISKEEAAPENEELW